MHLTFDVEVYMPVRGHSDWLHQQDKVWQRVLALLETHQIRVTCFTTGEFVEVFPNTFERMVRAGHEIASHTMTHRFYQSIGDEEFEAEIARSKTFLEEASGQQVQGFRAPQGQIPPHVSRMLQRHGYTYDSSVAATHIPGHFQGLGTPRHIYRAALENVRREDNASPLWEIPVAVTPLLPLPYGGFFLSLTAPVARVRRLRRALHVMYLHPYDFMDLRRCPLAFVWDKVKLTGNTWSVLHYFCRHFKGRDMSLKSLLPPGDAAPGR